MTNLVETWARSDVSRRLDPGIPAYLEETYWWAYVHPKAVRFFERQWLVNLILWGNFERLRDCALDELGARLPGRTLQVACVYGDFTPQLARRVQAGDGSLDVVDVLPIQLANLRSKLGPASSVNLVHRDASDLGFDDAAYDRVILFFLLHEVPQDVRRRALAEALRVAKPGADIVIVDYHRPAAWHPLRALMRWILKTFEPFALDLWANDIAHYLPQDCARSIDKQTFCAGLYQKIVLRGARG